MTRRTSLDPDFMFWEVHRHIGERIHRDSSLSIIDARKPVFPPHKPDTRTPDQIADDIIAEALTNTQENP